MSTLFISHSSRDNDFARELERELAKTGHNSVFLDFDPEKGIIGGQSWEQTLYRKLRACKAVIAICTDAYLSSKWCFAEIALARMEGKPIFALKTNALSDSTGLPSILSDHQYIKMHPNKSDGYARLWRGLKEMDLVGHVGQWNPKEAPYLGLSAFHEKHAPLFFGREKETRIGLELLEKGSPKLIMTLGSSGSGKSSLVRAGIVPRLRQHKDRWLIVEPFRPGRDPFRELANAIILSYKRYAQHQEQKIGSLDQLTKRLNISSQIEIGAPSEQLNQGELSNDSRVRRLISQLEELNVEPPANAQGNFLQFLDWSLDDLKNICSSPDNGDSSLLAPCSSILIELAENLKRASACPHARVLIVIDQFEELLTRSHDEDNSNAFLKLIRHSIELEHSPISVIGTMRSDFLTPFQQNPQIRDVDFESLSLGPMPVDGIRRVIEAPAKLGAIELETGLADRLIADTGNPSALPLLSFTLWKLWRDYRDDGVIQVKEYEELGGLDGAIASEAGSLLKPKEANELRRAFLQMVRLTDEGLYARNPVEWNSEHLTPVHSTLEKFVERRLLVTHDQNGQRIVEVAHESLFNAWEPLKNWLKNHSADLLLKKDLAREATAWQNQKRPEANLWRGARLHHAKDLLKQDQLKGTQKEFIQKSGRNERLRRIAITATIATIIILLSALSTNSYLAQKRAEDSRRQAAKSYKNFIEAVSEVMHKLLPNGRPGSIQIDSSILNTHGKASASPQVAKGTFGKGRVLALAHEGAITMASPESELFMAPALAWASLNFTETPKVYYTTGHCELVSDNKSIINRLPLQSIQQWGYEISPLSNLTDLSIVEPDSVLIIGDAWSNFKQAELDALRNYSSAGGSVLLAGLRWRWDKHRTDSDTLNPCSLSEGSQSRTVDSERYAMNTIGEIFGLKWVSKQ